MIIISSRLLITVIATHTLKTGIPVEEGDSILKLLRRVSRPEIQLGVVFYSELSLEHISDVTIITF